MSTEEEWRPFGDGTYEASSLGRIRRLKPASGARVGAVLKPNVKRQGYAYFVMRSNGDSVTHYVHDAVAAAFIGPKPSGMCVNHIDGDKLNNRPSNLEYTTYSGNAIHASRMGRVLSGDRHPYRTRPEIVPRGDTHSCSLVTEETVRAMRSAHEAGEKQKDIARTVGLSAVQTSKIINRHAWRHVK